MKEILYKVIRPALFSMILLAALQACKRTGSAVVFQSDFGVKDGAVSAMKGVSLGVSENLQLYDLTHEIPPYNIWEAAYRLEQTASYWPRGTVFVSVVDPGVGTDRKSVVMKSRSGHFFVTPDNGTLTLVAESLGIEEVRQINEEINRRQNSAASYTFHGRDVYAYTAARLASGTIRFDDVGPKLPASVVRLEYEKPALRSDSIVGSIPILDIQYGNAWTNIPDSLVRRLGVREGDSIVVRIFQKTATKYTGSMPFVTTFGAIAENSILAYSNSLMNLSFAVNMGNFADSIRISSGPEWRVCVKKHKL